MAVSIPFNSYSYRFLYYFNSSPFLDMQSLISYSQWKINSTGLSNKWSMTLSTLSFSSNIINSLLGKLDRINVEINYLYDFSVQGLDILLANWGSSQTLLNICYHLVCVYSKFYSSWSGIFRIMPNGSYIFLSSSSSWAY